MAAFAKSTFNAHIYAASRPTYPQQLFDFVFRYHEHGYEDLQTRSRVQGSLSLKKRRLPERSCAVDLGCGTGQATIGLLPFNQIIGVDPSGAMIQNARKYIDDELQRQKKRHLKDRFEFVQSSTEDLSFLQEGSVDLVIAAQAAHWFDWKKLWIELARVLRSNGTVAVWGYSEMRLTQYPSLTPLINAYTHGPDPRTSLGPHWQQPGRSIVENLLRDIPSPESIVHDAFFAERRIYYSGPHFPSIPDAQPVVLRKSMSWDNFESYLRSFSPLNTFQEQYPEDAKHPDGDIVQRFLKTLKAAILETDITRGKAPTNSPEMGGAEGSNHDSVEIEWPLVLILAKKE